ncbi:MAG: DsbC family protein [Pseudomonadota bacterium]
MMTRSISAFFGLLLLSAGAAAQAANGAPADVAATIKSRIEAGFAGVHVEHVQPTPWAGLYEVLAGDELVYTTADASVVIAGNAVDVKSGRNLTAERLGELRSIDWNTLPLDLAIKVVKGDGSRKLAVFADPLCPYCQKLETEMKDVTNVTIYTFPFPLETVHPGATEKARQIWCAADRGAVWTEWMVNHTTTPARADCDTTGLTAARDLGTKLKVNSTPTLFFGNGRRFDGALERSDLEQRLNAAQAAPGTAAKDKVSATASAPAAVPPG